MTKKAGNMLKTLCKTSSLSLHRQTPAQMDLSERYCYRPSLKWNPKVEEYFIKAYGQEHFSRISYALTRPSCYSCIRVNTLKSTSDAVIGKLSAILEERGLQNGMTRISDGHKDTENFCSKPLEIGESANTQETYAQDSLVSKCQIPGLDHVVFVKGTGPHAIDYGLSVGKSPKEVIVSRKCAEAVLRGAQVYVPGVLACSSHVEKGDVVAVSVAVEQPGADGGWGANITRGTILQGSPAAMLVSVHAKR